MQYKGLIFDFYGVVCSELAPFWFEEHFNEKGKQLKDQYVRPADLGEITQEQLFKELSEMANVSSEEIEKDWEAHAHFNTELIEYIRKLKGNYKIGLLSNSPSPLFHTLMALSGAANLFDAVVVSSEVGFAKPDPEIYKIALERLQLSPEEVLMIDDGQVNVDGAKQLGMAGCLYTSLQDLKEFLGE